jgi:septal ring factor EnvC (AmiA/AmiB activator)
MGIVVNWSGVMGDLHELSRVLGSVEKGQASIEEGLERINAKLDKALPMVTDHDNRLRAVETQLSPLVEAHNRRLWVRLGWGAALGTTVSSPLWLTKLMPFLASLPK